MIYSDIINARQNEEANLKIQYAARKNFNRAELINYFSWALCLLSAFIITLPDSIPKGITLGLPALLSFIAFFVTRRLNKAVQNAADLRNYFDSRVLMIKEKSYTKKERQKIKELVEKTYLRNKSDAEISIKHTGKDTPPGVRDWYNIKDINNGLAAQFECQCQNIWWNKKMVNKRLILFAIILLALAIFFIISVILLKTDIINILACLIAITLKIIERIIVHKKYYDISIKIDALQDYIERSLTTCGIEELQDLINKRRKIPVLEMNIIHKNMANKLTSLYEKTSNQ